MKDILRNGALIDIGKPELLKGSLAGLYSRYIDDKNRLIYTISENGDIEILQCKGHYNDK